jgi:hypothetical protein
MLLPKDGDVEAGYHDRPLFDQALLEGSRGGNGSSSSSGGAGDNGGGARPVDESPKRPRGSLRLPTGCFVGRALEVCGVYRSLHHPSFKVCVVAGGVGVGKTEVCLKALQHSFVRAEFSAYLYVDVKEVAAQAMAAAAAEGSSATVDMAGHLARAVLAAQSQLWPSADPPSGPPVRRPGSPEAGLLPAADAVAAFVARQGRQSAVLFLDGGEHLWAPHAAAIACAAAAAAPTPFDAAGAPPPGLWGLGAAQASARVVGDLSQRCERLRVVLGAASGGSASSAPWPGLDEVSVWPWDEGNRVGIWPLVVYRFEAYSFPRVPFCPRGVWHVRCRSST